MSDALHTNRRRVLEIRATLAGWKADYLCRGIERRHSERGALESELAALELAIFDDQAAVAKAKKATSAAVKSTLLTCLVQVCNERKCGHLVAEAMQRSTALAAEVIGAPEAALSGSDAAHD